MARSQETFGKKEIRNKKEKKRKDKEARKLARKENESKGGGLDSMMAYVDENGQIVDTPPDPTIKKKKIKAEDIEIGIPKKEAEEAFDGDLTGKVDYFDTSKGFGFILDSRNQAKYFVHVSQLIDEIAEGDKVTFELEQGLKGLNAVKVKKL